MPAHPPYSNEAKRRSLTDSRPRSDFEEKLRLKAKRQRRLRFIVRILHHYSVDRSRRTQQVVLSVLFLLVLIAAGVAVAVIIVKRNNVQKSSNFDNVDDGTGATTSGGKGTTIVGDPSVFQKDPNLHRSLYGLAYTPEGSLPDYGCNIRLGASGSSLDENILVAYSDNSERDKRCPTHVAVDPADSNLWR